MLKIPLSESPHSAAVTLTLLARNGSFPLSKIGSNKIVLEGMPYVQAGDAEVIMSIDGRAYRWGVNIRRDVVFEDTIRVRLRQGRRATP